MAQQKLYTEEQVRKAIDFFITDEIKKDKIIKTLVPIELRNDEDIEKEIRDILELFSHHYGYSIEEAAKDICGLLTPIELPSDEEINVESEIAYRQYPSNPKEHTDWKYGEDVNAHRKIKAFIKGAKWMKDKILNQNL